MSDGSLALPVVSSPHSTHVQMKLCSDIERRSPRNVRLVVVAAIAPPQDPQVIVAPFVFGVRLPFME